jgi:hypothetical protein
LKKALEGHLAPFYLYLNPFWRVGHIAVQPVLVSQLINEGTEAYTLDNSLDVNSKS